MPTPSKISWRSPITMVALGFILRLLWMTLLHTYRFAHTNHDFGFGWETGRIARALATGHGFSDPFNAPTGPTAWIAPLYPYLLAVIFKLFGVYSTASAWITLAVNSLFSALNAWTLYAIADRCFSRSAALWSGWIWAAFPYCFYWAVRWPWETALAALLLSVAFLLTLRLANIARTPQQNANQKSLRDWVLFAITWAVIALTNPSLLTLLPFAGFWALVRQREIIRPRRALLHATLAGAIFLALLAPWTARNYLVFGKLIPLRGNFWVEFRLGNNGATDGLWASWAHPTQDAHEFALYRQLGEVGFAQRAKQLALAQLHRDPRHFAQSCFNRIYFFWCDIPRAGERLDWLRLALFSSTSIIAFLGAALLIARRHPAAFLFCALLLAVPFVYYLTFPHPRYRAPMEPLILVLSVHLFQSAEPAKPERRKARST